MSTSDSDRGEIQTTLTPDQTGGGTVSPNRPLNPPQAGPAYTTSGLLSPTYLGSEAGEPVTPPGITVIQKDGTYRTSQGDGTVKTGTVPTSSDQGQTSSSDQSPDSATQNQSFTFPETSPIKTSFDVPSDLISGEEGIPLKSVKLRSIGAYGDVTWKSTTALPDGLTLDAKTGLISGTPTQRDIRTVEIVGTDGKGNQGKSNFTFNIFPKMIIDIPTAAFAVNTGSRIGLVVRVLGGSGVYRFSLDTDHYPNLFIDPYSGGITGNFFKPGLYNVGISVYDGYCTLTQDIPFSVSGVVVNEAMFPGPERSPSTLAGMGMAEIDQYKENISKEKPDYPLALKQIYRICCRLCADPAGAFLDKFRILMSDYGGGELSDVTYLHGYDYTLSRDEFDFLSKFLNYWRGIIYQRKPVSEFDWNDFLRITRSQDMRTYLLKFGGFNPR